MVTVVGILAETTTATAGSTTTLYTVPADKHARVRILYLHEGGGGTTQGNLMIFSPNSEQTIHDTGGAGIDRISGGYGALSAGTTTTTITPQVDSIVHFGLVQSSNQIDLDGVSFTGEWLGMPFPADYFGSAGDIIEWRFQNQAAGDCLIQVIGIEADNDA